MIAARAFRHSAALYVTWLGALLLPLTTSCGGSVATTTYGLECETGTLGCSCYGNWSCNYQLSCVEDTCIDRKSQPSSADKPSADTELAGASSLPDPLAAAASDECVFCIHTECSTALEACYPETGCVALQACLLECADQSPEHAACDTECEARAPANARLKSAPVSQCRERACGACQTAS